MDKFLSEKFLGVYIEVSDDRTLTNYTLMAGYKTVYQSTSLVYTDAPTKEEANNPMVVVRKLQSPGCMPLYAAQGVDISYDVVMALNAAYTGHAPSANNGGAAAPSGQ